LCVEKEEQVKKLLLTVATVLIMSGGVFADHFNAVKKAGDLTVRIQAEQGHFQVGENRVGIVILDQSGGPIGDADVAVYYFMPSMPAMNYKVQALYDGTKYAAVLKPVMPGAWDADITIIRNGEDAHEATISFNVQ
jgi:nitrogen fixation protein FixH